MHLKTILQKRHPSYLHLLVATQLLCFFNAYDITAQTISVTGTVVDEKNEGLPGASVILKGSNQGTTTNETGAFRIEIPEGLRNRSILMASFIGYNTEEQSLGSQSHLQFKLRPDDQQLSELVVVGYGTQKKSDLTGAVSSVAPAALKQPVSSLDRILQGTVSGVQVTQTSGQPGSAVSIRIRGGNSINGGNEPLYVIDGFPVYNNNSDATTGVMAGPSVNALSALNPNDIESIDVLKDASATAIYGARGANGVVIITTKKGVEGKNTVSYDAYYGVQKINKFVDVLTDARQWAELKNEARVNAGKTPYYAQERLDELTGGTDWQRAAFSSAPVQNHQLSFSGGDKKTRYAISGGYFSQEGILKNTGFDRLSLRVNLDRNISDRLKIGTNLATSRIYSRVAQHGVINALLKMPPAVDIYDENGQYTYQSEFETPLGNPIATLAKEKNNSTSYRIFGNSFAEIKIIEGLKARVSLGLDIVNTKENRFIPSDIFQGNNSNPTGKATVGAKFISNWLNENTLTYDRPLGDKHHLNVLAGFTQQAYRNEHLNAGSEAFVTDQLGYNDLGSGAIYTQPGSNAVDWSLISYLSRINYHYDQRYFLTISARADGSSRFGKNNKWGYFPSAAVAWNIGRERFFDAVTHISSLKIRLSAGLTGNQEIGQYQSLATMGTNTYFFGGQTYVGFHPTRIANPQLSWETTAQYDAGIDLSLFGNRVHLNADLYLKKTRDLLLNVPVPYTTGQSTSLQNYGSVQNKGYELTLSSDNLGRGNFRWKTLITYAANQNKVLSLGDDASYIISNANIVKTGEALGSFYGYRTHGIFQLTDPIAELPTIDPNKTFPGDQRYHDLNGDGVITQASDRAIIGSAQPKFIAGITNSLSYKGFDLNILFNATYGNQLYNINRQGLESLSGQQNASVTALDRWTPTHPGNVIPRPFDDPSVIHKDRFVENASFLRLRDVTLSYTLPASLISKARLSNARVYVTGQNIWTLTKYSGYDPEASRNEQNTINQGIDNNVYPLSKSFQIGLSLSL